MVIFHSYVKLPEGNQGVLSALPPSMAFRPIPQPCPYLEGPIHWRPLPDADVDERSIWGATIPWLMDVDGSKNIIYRIYIKMVVI